MASVALHHIAIACANPQVIEQFYTQHFGFRRTRAIPVGDSAIVFLKLGDCYLELFQATEPAPVPPPAKDGPWFPGWRHLAFKVDDVDATLTAMGDAARITLGPLSFDDVIPGWRTAWLADPEGNIVEISQGYTDPEGA
jgi:glyoxylase I family protein